MDDLISEFIEETAESLSVLDVELVKLEQNPNDKEILGNIFRLVHTIKGTCGFLGLPRLERVAHAGENVLGKVRDGEIEATAGVISIVLEALDTIKDIMDHLAENGEEPEGDDTDIINRLNAYTEEAAAPEAPAAPAEDAQQEVAEAPVAEEAAEETVEAKPSDGGMKLPDNEGGLSQEALDALERAFQEAEPTIEGGDADAGADIDIDADADAEANAAMAAMEEEDPLPEDEPPAAPQVPVAAEEEAKPAAKPKPTAKEKAIKEGLAAGAGNKEPSSGGALANQSIRVNLEVLESLMQMVGELVLTRNQLLQIVRNRDDNEFNAPLQHLSHITTELQEGVMKTRMQPIGNAWAKFPRLIRDLSIELGKKIELRMVGAETELDRQLLELIKDPLTHMVRNSCDHGLETPEQRQETGKQETGTVTLSAYHEGGHIIIEIADDGKGINPEIIKNKAISNGLTTEEEASAMAEQQILQFIFKPGFSTAEKVTSVSGRGVGMDVVRTNIEKIGGTVELTSEVGKGSTFHIKIPLTLAIVSVLIVESGTQRFAIPQINVLELVRSAEDSEFQLEHINNAAVLRLRDKLLPLVSLKQILDLPDQPDSIEEELQEKNDERYIVVCKVGGNDFGLIVDRIFDTEEIVVKPVSTLLQHISVYSGNTILGDGSVIMILDPNGMARAAGELEASAKQDGMQEDKMDKGMRRVNFLLFKSGEAAPKAVPLELVSRLEEIDTAQIEFSGELPVIQYRDELMRLTRLDNKPIEKDGMCDVIVFTYDNKTIGLMVDEIMDIVEAPLSVKLSSTDEALLGSMVIANKTTDIVDVGYLLKDMAGDISNLNILQDKRVESFHLLLVEDSVFFRNLTVPFLEAVGYKVTAAPDAHEALGMLNNPKYGFDAIVTDIEMPEMDGFEFSERLRGDKRFDDVPIIAFTSTINQHFLERSQEIGINEFILKTDRETLVETIARHLLGEAEGDADVA